MRAIALTVLAVVVSCGSGSSAKVDTDGSGGSLSTTISPAQSTAPTTIAPTTTLAPTTTTDPLATARADFLAMEAEWLTATDLAYIAHDSTGRLGDTGAAWVDWPAVAAELAVIDEKLAADVAGYGWPNELRVPADELSLALTVRAAVFRDCAELPGDYFGQAPIFDRQDAAYLALNAARDTFRLALGLPPVDYA